MKRYEISTAKGNRSCYKIVTANIVTISNGIMYFQYKDRLLYMVAIENILGIIVKEIGD